jgi:hypothetical protein
LPHPPPLTAPLQVADKRKAEEKQPPKVLPAPPGLPGPPPGKEPGGEMVMMGGAARPEPRGREREERPSRRSPPRVGSRGRSPPRQRSPGRGYERRR